MNGFRTFSHLSRYARAGRDFVIEVRNGKSGFAIMAPHGGAIEPMTAEVASVIAGRDHSYYAFKGIRSGNNGQLHIASHRFDEPRAAALMQRNHTIVTIHGCRAAEPVVYLGGRDKSLNKRLVSALTGVHIAVEEAPTPGLGGIHPLNLCNRGFRGKGVQLELSRGFRRHLAGPAMVLQDSATPLLHRFAHAVRQALAEHLRTLAR